MSDTPFPWSHMTDTIGDAAAALKAGHLVAFPTETVYGLGADATNPMAVKRIYEVKGRPTNHPLIVHISSIDHLQHWANEIPDYAFSLGHAFWPGPVTLILKRSDLAGDFITGGQDSVGIRVPKDPIALGLLRQFEFLGGLGVAAPSANRFGQVSPTSSSDVQEEIGQYLKSADLILQAGPSEIGIESTILDCRREAVRILRPGAVTAEMVGEIHRIENPHHPMDLRFSGNLIKHYAPVAKILLNQKPMKGQGFIAMSHFETPKGVSRLCSPTSVDEFAAELYRALRRADNLGLVELVIQIPEGDGLAEAIRDRIVRAAGGR